MRNAMIYMMLGCLSLSALDSAWAQGKSRERSRAPIYKKVGDGAGLISPEEAAERAKAQHNGKILSTRLARRGDGSPYYAVKILSDGKVQTVHVDARATR